MRFTIDFFDNQGQLTETCTFYVSLTDRESPFDKLEEVLYITQELTPVKPLTWWRELFNNDFTTYFTYHSIQKVRVNYDFHNNHFICEDID